MGVEKYDIFLNQIHITLLLRSIQQLIGWDSMKVNDEHQLNLIHFMHTYIST